jgi:transposase
MISRIHIGSDLAKRWFDVHIFFGRETFVCRYTNDATGFKLFLEKVQSLDARKVHICMEHTGGYELPLARFCKEAGFIVSIVDGGKIHHYRRSFTSTGAGTDQTSAYHLARYCKERRPEEWFEVPDEYRKLRELIRHRQRLIEDRTAWSCRAGHTVEDELVGAQRRMLIEVLKTSLKDLEKRIKAHIKAHPNLTEAMRLLVSIPGVAFISGMRILAESGPIGCHSSARSYAMSAGLTPIVIHSGQRVPPGKLPVYGNKELRSAFYFSSVVCKRSEKGAGEFILRLLKEGEMVKMGAIVAGMRKLAHIVYGVLSSGQPFDVEKMRGPSPHKKTA